MKAKWRITVTPTAQKLHPKDRNVGGQYEVKAQNEDEALDSIGPCRSRLLDDFRIEATPALMRRP